VAGTAYDNGSTNNATAKGTQARPLSAAAMAVRAIANRHRTAIRIQRARHDDVSRPVQPAAALSPIMTQPAAGRHAKSDP
jgi:hypothetical protein